MDAKIIQSPPTSHTAVGKMLESAYHSVASALLSENQRLALDDLCAQADALCAADRADDARRVMKLALSLIACGPPVKD